MICLLYGKYGNETKLFHIFYEQASKQSGFKRDRLWNFPTLKTLVKFPIQNKLPLKMQLSSNNFLFRFIFGRPLKSTCSMLVRIQCLQEVENVWSKKDNKNIPQNPIQTDE
jgi:hypothetical protein